MCACRNTAMSSIVASRKPWPWTASRRAPFFRRQGYLFLAGSARAAAVMQENHALQTGLGCQVDLLDVAGLAARFPSLRTDDVLCATHSPGDGWIDSHAALMALRRKMRALGVSYIADAVAGLEVSSGLVRAVALESGEALEGDLVVNNAGAWAHEIGAMIGLDIPVRPMPRTTWYFGMPSGDRADAAHHRRTDDQLPARRHRLYLRHIRL